MGCWARPPSAPTPSAATHQERPTLPPTRLQPEPCTTSLRCRSSSEFRLRRSRAPGDSTRPADEAGGSTPPPPAYRRLSAWRYLALALVKRPHGLPTVPDCCSVPPSLPDSAGSQHYQHRHSGARLARAIAQPSDRRPLLTGLQRTCDRSWGRHGHPLRDLKYNRSRSTTPRLRRTCNSPEARGSAVCLTALRQYRSQSKSVTG